MFTRFQLMYKIVRNGFNIGDPDIVISKHRTEKAARKAFSRNFAWPVRLINPEGKTIDHCILA